MKSESDSDFPEGVIAALGLIAMVVLVTAVGFESPATGPMAALSGGLFATALVVHLNRHWRNPKADSFIADIRRYRWVLAAFAVGAIVFAAFEAASVLHGMVGAVVLFIAVSSMFLMLMMGVDYIRLMYSLAAKSHGKFLENPRGWLSIDVLFAFLPALFTAGVIASAFIF